jgi:hypothetical protein
MTNVYRIGVSIAMTNGVSPVLGVIAREVLGLHAGVGKLEAGFSRLKLAIGGALAVAGGVAILASFKKPLEEAERYQTALARFKQFGMSDGINAAADKYARATKVMGASATDMMRFMVEAQGVFRESGQLTEAQALLGSRIAAPILAKINFANTALKDEDQGRYHAQDLMMLRFIEARGGANDPATFSKIADWGYKLIASSGGNVDWGQLRSLVKTAGAAGFNLTENAISKLEPVITDMGGGTVGSGMRVAFSRLLGIQRELPKQAIQEYLSLGLWNPGNVELSAGGGIKKFSGKPGDVLKDREKFATDPVAFYVENFLPAISKKYGAQILGDTTSAKVQRAAEITNVFGPGTAGNVFSQIDKLMPAIKRSIDAQNKALGIDASDKNAASTMRGKEIILQKNWQTLMLQVGEHVLPIAIKALTLFNNAVEKLSAWATKHPGQMGALVKGIMIFGGALIGVGVALVGMAIFAGGWIPVAIAGAVGLVSALGTFAALNWDAVTRAGSAVADFFRRVWAAIENSPLRALLPQGSRTISAAEAAENNRHAWNSKLTAGQSIFDLNPNGFATAVPPRAANSNVQVHTQVNLDGKAVAKVVSHHQASAIGAAALSGARYDPFASLPATALGYQR